MVATAGAWIIMSDRYSGQYVPLPPLTMSSCNMQCAERRTASWSVDRHDEVSRYYQSSSGAHTKVLQILVVTGSHEVPFPDIAKCPVAIQPQLVARGRRGYPDAPHAPSYDPQQERIGRAF